MDIHDDMISRILDVFEFALLVKVYLLLLRYTPKDLAQTLSYVIKHNNIFHFYFIINFSFFFFA